MADLASFAALMLEYLEILSQGVFVTLIVTAGAFVLAAAFGLVVAIIRVFGGPLAAPALAYIELFRGTPVLIQLFIIYFGLAEFGLRLEPLEAAVIGLGLNGAAYLAEVFRAGIVSIHAGQMESALAVGMTRLMAMRLVVLPQAVRVTLPPTGNYLIGLLKDTAIVSVVAAPEIMFHARQLVTRTFDAAPIYLLTALIYLVFSLPLAWAVRRLERREGRWRLN